MKIGAPGRGLMGLALAAWLLAELRRRPHPGLLGTAGWFGIAAVIAFHLVQMLFSAAAWRSVAGPRRRGPSLRGFCVLRWIREGVNNLLPVAQIGGEFVAARLLHRRGVPLAPAIAGTVADLTMEMVTQIAFTLLGLALLLHGVGGGRHGQQRDPASSPWRRWSRRVPGRAMVRAGRRVREAA